MTYPFLIRGPTRYARVKIVKIEAGSFRYAMLKAFALYPVKFVNFKFARNMDLISAKQQAKKESMDGKTRYVVSHKDGECTVELTEPGKPGDVLHAVFAKGKEIKESIEAPKTTSKKEKPVTEEDVIESAEKENKSINKQIKPVMKTKNKPAKKVAAKKPVGDRIPRGNNMYLSAPQWAKVDKVRGDESFSSFSRGLVLKKIGE